MTIRGLDWGMKVTGVSPMAKLLAIRLGDSCDIEGVGQLGMPELLAWVCTTEPDALAALRELRRACAVHWDVDGEILFYHLPPDAAAPPRDTDQPDSRPLWLYVLTGRVGTKIGITAHLPGRIAGLRQSLMDDTIVAAWSEVGPAYKVRRAERAAHKALNEHLLRNEWFSIGPEAAIEVARRILKEETGRS